MSIVLQEVSRSLFPVHFLRNQEFLDKLVDLSIKYGVDVGKFEFRSRVFHEAVWVEDVVSDLGAERDVEFSRFVIGGGGSAFFEFELV